MYNKTILIGRAGNDAEVKFTTGENKVGEFRLATSVSWTDKMTGERKEKTQWHTIVGWGKLAERMGSMVKKGALVQVDGSIEYDKWEKDGQKHEKAKIVAVNFLMLSAKGEVASTGYGSNMPDDVPF